MANHKSAKKSIRQIAKRSKINTDRTSRMRTFVRKLEETITTGDKAASQEAMRVAQSELALGAKKGIIKKETASRKISRLAARVKAIA